jgi:hypothetical protein
VGALSLTGTLSTQVNKVALVGALEIECGLRLWRKFNQFNGLLEMERERYGARTPDVISETPPSAFIAYYCGLRLPRPPIYIYPYNLNINFQFYGFVPPIFKQQTPLPDAKLFSATFMTFRLLLHEKFKGLLWLSQNLNSGNSARNYTGRLLYVRARRNVVLL